MPSKIDAVRGSNLRSQARRAALRHAQASPTVAPAELPALLSDISARLISLGVAEDDARDIALAAWSEVEGRRTGAYIDLEISTPWLIFLADPITGVRWPLPAADLVRMLGPRLVEPVAQPAGRS
jgi:hypothetical protein